MPVRFAATRRPNRSASRCRKRPIRSGTAICRTCGPDRSTATACTARTIPRAGIASIRARCCSILTRRPSRASCAGTMRCSARDRDTAHCAPLARVVDSAFHWNGDRPPRTPWHETVVYELHVKGFTKQHPDVPENLRGTYAGLASPAAIEYLRELGVTAVELLPVHYHIDEHFLVAARPRELLGLQHARLFRARSALRRERAGGRGAGVPGDGARLHAAGHRGHSRRGLQPHRRRQRARPDALASAASTTPPITASPTIARATSISPAAAIRSTSRTRARSSSSWIRCAIGCSRCTSMVSASISPARSRASCWEVDRLGAFFDIIHQDPVLSEVKLIAEPWDLGPNGYQVGNFPVLWTEWNGKYRDCVRRFWKGNGGTVGELASRLAGSSDLYAHNGRRPSASLNFITAHDGFTLARSRELQPQAQRGERRGKPRRVQRQRQLELRRRRPDRRRRDQRAARPAAAEFPRHAAPLARRADAPRRR